MLFEILDLHRPKFKTLITQGVSGRMPIFERIFFRLIYIDIKNHIYIKRRTVTKIITRIHKFSPFTWCVVHTLHVSGPELVTEQNLAGVNVLLQLLGNIRRIFMRLVTVFLLNQCLNITQFNDTPNTCVNITRTTKCFSN